MIANVRIRLKTFAEPTLRRYDTERLKDEPVRLEYENMLKKKPAEFMCNEQATKQSTVEDTWSNIKNLYNSVAKELLGYEKRQKTMPWISKEVLELSDKRKEMKATRYKDEECGKNYKR